MDSYDVQEIAFGWALEAVATGETKAATDAAIARMWPSLDSAVRAVVLRDAYIEATAAGIERDDIDHSWRR